MTFSPSKKVRCKWFAVLCSSRAANTPGKSAVFHPARKQRSKTSYPLSIQVSASEPTGRSVGGA